MNDRKQGKISLRTALLMLLVTLMIFSLFVVLPIHLPSADSMDTVFDKMFWSCTYWNSPPIIHHTWTWDTDEQPTEKEWINLLYEARYYIANKCVAMMKSTYTEPDTGILQDMHRIRPDDGYGKLHFDINPENEDQIIVSGYLQYGYFEKPEPAAIDYLSETYSGNYGQTIDINDLLRTSPVPTKLGVMRNKPIGVGLTTHYAMNSTREAFATITDENGYFSYIIEPDPEAKYIDITVGNMKQEIASKGRGSPPITYQGNSVFYTNFFDCNYAGFDKEEEKEKQRAWIFAGIIFAAAAFLIAWYLWHKKHSVLFEYEEEEERPQKDMFEEIETLPGGDTDRLAIIFPQIEDDLADVWSHDDALEVHFRLKDTEGNPVPDTGCYIAWGDGQTENARSGTEGEIRNTHVFTDKDEYIISGSYTDTVTRRDISSWRIIRIVDYREEMVQLFNRMLASLDIDTIDIDERMTAREIKQVLEPELADIPTITVDVIVKGFEEANYSIHPISRDSYIRMYRAVKEVIDFGKREREPEQDTTE